MAVAAHRRPQAAGAQGRALGRRRRDARASSRRTRPRHVHDASRRLPLPAVRPPSRRVGGGRQSWACASLGCADGRRQSRAPRPRCYHDAPARKPAISGPARGGGTFAAAVAGAGTPRGEHIESGLCAGVFSFIPRRCYNKPRDRPVSCVGMTPHYQPGGPRVQGQRAWPLPSGVCSTSSVCRLGPSAAPARGAVHPHRCPESSSGSKSSDGWYLDRDAARHWNPEDLKLVHLDIVLLEAYLRLLSRLEILLLL